MKKVFKPFIMVAAVAGMMSVSSCQKDCDAYTGNDASKLKEELVGNYTASESKNNGAAYSYSGSISASSANAETVIINRIPNGANFFNTNITATFSGNALTIANQEPDGDGYFIQGQGSFTPGCPSVVSLTYTVSGPDEDGNPATDSYSATWTHD